MCPNFGHSAVRLEYYYNPINNEFVAAVDMQSMFFSLKISAKLYFPVPKLRFQPDR